MLTLREAREERGLSQRALALKAGCAKLTVLRAEAGRPILPAVRSAILKALGTKDVDIRVLDRHPVAV